jgi:hypothetical protein
MDMTVWNSRKYDESALTEELAPLDVQQCVLFSAACAERLMLALKRACDALGREESFHIIREALDLGWSIHADSSSNSRHLDQIRNEVEHLVPKDDDENWVPSLAIVQNAAAAVAYMLRGWVSGDRQNSVWAARQLFEAADFLAQGDSSSGDYVGAEEPERSVQLALTGIGLSLEGVKSKDVELLRSQADADGKELAEFLSF